MRDEETKTMQRPEAEYQISSELIGHEGGVRAICTAFENPDILYTGAMDSCVRCWTRTGNGYELSTIGAYEHEHWVTAILNLPPGVLAECPDGGFITGCMDKRIRIYSSECILVRTLFGHEGGVISLAWCLVTGHLISGSWDGTARVWNIATAECQQVMSGHENGVCVLGLPNGTIVTGSTGEQRNNTVVNFHIRIWKNEQVQQQLSDHQGPVRQLVLVPDVGFLSCSNDGTIKLRSFDGEPLIQMSHPLNNEGKPGFVLSITRLRTGEFVSASEDCSARVWSSDGELKQVVMHPSGLWTVFGLPNGDFVTGCDDKVARVFTSSKERLSASAAASFASAVQEALVLKEKGPSSVDIGKLPAIENSAQIRGKSDGDVQMFRKGGKAWACQWSSVSGTWVEIGEVTGTGTESRGVIDGVAFDMVIPVEIENPRTGGLQKLQIGYNQGENPFTVAQQFIDKYMLDQNYLREIADYIAQRSGQGRAPVIGCSDLSESSSTSVAPPLPPATTFQHFPQHGYTSFDSLKISKLMETLKQFNDNIKLDGKERETPAALNDSDIDIVEQIVKTLQGSAYYHVSKFPADSRRVISTILKEWPAQYVFPALDLVRLMMTHPDGSVVVPTEDQGQDFVQSVLKIGLTDDPNAPNSVRMLSLRILTNMFVHEVPRGALLRCTKNICPTFSQFASIDHKSVRLSLASLLLNYSVAAYKDAIPVSADLSCDQFSEAVETLLKTPNVEPDVALCCAIAVGTLLLKYPAYRPSAASLIRTLSMHAENETLQQCISELQSI